MAEQYQFLRYYIPGALTLVYFFSLILANIDAETIRLMFEKDLLVFIISAFATSPIIGYLVYQFYDGLLYNEIAKCGKRASLSLLNKWAGETEFCRIHIWEVKKELIDLGLYSSMKNKSQISMRITDTLRGFWSHANARLVSSIFVPLASIILYVIFYFIMRGMNIRVIWNDSSASNNIIVLILIGALSAFIGYPARRTIKEAFVLEEFIIRSRKEVIKDFMRQDAENVKKATKLELEKANVGTGKDSNIDQSVHGWANLVDSKYRRRKLSIRGFLQWIVLQVLLIFVIIAITFILQPYITEAAIFVSFYIGVLAVYVALNNSIRIRFEMTPEELIKFNYEQLKGGEDEQPFLLSLIEMKHRQPDICLAKMVKECPSLFGSDKLYQKLYEPRS